MVAHSDEHSSLVSLERDQIISPPVQDFAGNVPLATHCIQGDDTSPDHQRIEKVWDCRYLVRLVID